MAAGHLRLSFHIPILTILILLKTGNCCFSRIFCFGDSISDTGNYLNSIGDNYDPVGNLPYGETYFNRPTGRYSDGRLILDFIAEEYGLPLIPPYISKESTENFRHGVNFAVAGATALDNSFFESMGIEVSWTNYSLGAQLEWFKKLLPSILEEPGCDSSVISSALFVVGEIGGNDYNHPFLQGRTLDKVQTFVPDVIRTISLTIHELISCGAKTLLVPNNFPIGCLPVYLTLFQSQKKEDYDPETGCIKRLNEFAEYHNAMLLDELAKLRLLYDDVTIIYADYYEAFMSIIRNPKKLDEICNQNQQVIHSTSHQNLIWNNDYCVAIYGFSYPLMACCGAKGPYNFSLFALCGNQGSTICSEPSEYIAWDGLHLTEAAYKAIARRVLRGSYSSPSISNTCSNIMHDSGSLLLVPSNTM